jgi:hypothetical protein
METVSTGESVEFFRLASRASALRLELQGLKHSSGRSVYALCKRVYGLRGTREFVSQQMDQMVEGALHAREWQRDERTWESIVEHNAALQWGELQRAYIRGVEGQWNGKEDDSDEA